MLTRATAAALIAFAVSIGLVTLSGCVAQPSHLAEATVVIDVYSGRENPSVPLGSAAADELRAFIEDREEAAEPSSAPEGQLGFRGFIVTFADADPAWASIRVHEDAVFIEDESGTREITDDEGTAFMIVWDDIRDRVDPAIATEVEGRP